jgi:hypothetical protein
VRRCHLTEANLATLADASRAAGVAADKLSASIDDHLRAMLSISKTRVISHGAERGGRIRIGPAETITVDVLDNTTRLRDWLRLVQPSEKLIGRRTVDSRGGKFDEYGTLEADGWLSDLCLLEAWFPDR